MLVCDRRSDFTVVSITYNIELVYMEPTRSKVIEVTIANIIIKYV